MLVLVILLILIASILLDILLIIGSAPLLSVVFFGGSLGGLGVVLKDFRALSVRCNLRKLLGLGLALSLLWS